MSFHKQMGNYLERRSRSIRKLRMSSKLRVMKVRASERMQRLRDFFQPIDLTNMQFHNQAPTIVDSALTPARQFWWDSKRRVKAWWEERNKPPAHVDPVKVREDIENHHFRQE